MKIIRSDTALTPAGNNLFEEGNSKRIGKKETTEFHNSVERGMFGAKIARPDINQTVAVFPTRVKEPNETDWKILVRIIKYLNGTNKKYLTMSDDDLKVNIWYVDASFAVQPDFNIHTGAIVTMAQGAMQSLYRKQKLNTRSSKEAELVAVDDASV